MTVSRQILLTVKALERPKYRHDNNECHHKVKGGSHHQPKRPSMPPSSA
jgi:hypothetical protein